MDAKVGKQILHRIGLWTGWADLTGSSTVRGEQVQGLLDLAAQLQELLVPVQPSTSYRRRLHGDLILEAQRRPVAARPSGLTRQQRIFLIGAATAGSLASVIGVVVAFIVHSRHGRATHAA